MLFFFSGGMHVQAFFWGKEAMKRGLWSLALVQKSENSLTFVEILCYSFISHKLLILLGYGRNIPTFV